MGGEDSCRAALRIAARGREGRACGGVQNSRGRCVAAERDTSSPIILASCHPSSAVVTESTALCTAAEAGALLEARVGWAGDAATELEALRNRREVLVAGGAGRCPQRFLMQGTCFRTHA